MNGITLWAAIPLTLLPLLSAAADERDPQIVTAQVGVQLTQVAEHPALTTPTGIDVDQQGHVWVVATHTHFRPDDYVGPEHDEILVFSDKDGDGQVEHRDVFYNATDATMDLELGDDGWVYLAERDRIIRIKDTDNDNKADVEETIVALNTEADYPHNGLEGLAWHPDGTLIFGLGENYAKPWTLTGTDDASMSGTGEGGIFRCSADGKRLRRIARGFWNPFGICVRSDGEIFAAENDPGERPPCRLLHIVEGGDYGYQRTYGSEAHHPFVAWNGELRGTLPMIHPSGEAPCGVLPIGNGLIVPSWSDHRVDFFKLRRKGASFGAERMPLIQGSRYFRPSCIASADHAIHADTTKRTWYLSDWVDGRYEAHGFGRLWKLEIDLKVADWVGKLPLAPPTTNSLLAAKLRDPNTPTDHSELLRIAQDADSFLANAALMALSGTAPQWTPEEVAKWSAGERVQAVLALKLASAVPDAWINAFLTDKNADVQFEALRWLADARLTQFLPDVEQFLKRSDLDYRRFEAAIATWNTLNGKPEDGVRNPTMLLAKVLDDQSAPRVRTYALRLLPKQSRSAPKDSASPAQTFPKGLTLRILQNLLSVEDAGLTREAVRTMAGNPRVSQNVLARIAGDEQIDAELRADAIAGLAAVADQHVDLLIGLAKDSQPVVREEALRCLRTGKLTSQERLTLSQLAKQYPNSGDAYEAILNPQAFATGRPLVSNTLAWLDALDAIESPANTEDGRRIFHHARLGQCAQCHRHNGRGNVVGPDLSGVNKRKDRTWLLRSILEPSSQMAPEFLPRTVLLKSGKTFTGIRLRSSTREAMRDANGQNRTFDRNDIESITESTVSFMPNNIATTLTLRELRDVLAFLESGEVTLNGQSAGIE